ncbi:exostosin-1 [Octopus bimaculoides]|uniref:exostosin-1 n=1 Tax=Octopus bimaculoides TaxID=37653 RepID=UPI0022E785B0|nr:exostosin-1 [Octopus bimaculoides]
MARNLMLWNSMPGAHFIMPEYSDAAITYPFYYRQLGREPSSQFTAIIYVVTPVTSSSSPLFRLVRNVAKSAYVHKILVIWHCDVSPPPPRKWPSDLAVPILVKTRNIKSISARFFPYRDVETDAVFSLDEDVLLNTDEVSSKGGGRCYSGGRTGGLSSPLQKTSLLEHSTFYQHKLGIEQRERLHTLVTQA